VVKSIKVKKQRWLRYKPPRKRNIELQFDRFWSLADAEKERAQRIRILNQGDPDDQSLAKELAKANFGKPATVMCCPVAARRFQIFFAGRSMKIAGHPRMEGFALTLLDPASAVPFSGLDNIDWRIMYLRVRRRLERPEVLLDKGGFPGGHQGLAL